MHPISNPLFPIMGVSLTYPYFASDIASATPNMLSGASEYDTPYTYQVTCTMSDAGISAHNMACNNR